MLKVVLCDDDDVYLQLMQKLIMNTVDKNRYNMKIVIATSLPGKVLHYLSREEGITLFMLETVFSPPEMDGIELAKGIRAKDRESYIVFCTSHSENIYKVMAGLIRPSGFLVKQQDSNEVEKFEIVVGDVYRDYLNFYGDSEAVLNINIGAEIHRVDYDDIVYLEAFQKKVYVHTSNQRIGYYDSLSALEEKLGEKFVRCHKSFIVNRDKVVKVCFSDMKITMTNGVDVDISRTFKPTIKEKINVFR